MDLTRQGARTLGQAADFSGYAQDAIAKSQTYQAMQDISSAKVARDPTMSEMILQQAVSLHKALAEIEARTENIVGKLGYPVGAETSADKTPSRGGALGSIADSLDATGPRLQRIMRYVDIISGQI